jgi:hypothetical protein
MSSEPDDGEPAAAAPSPSAVMRRHLIAALAAPSDDGVPLARKVVDALIARAREGDLAAIREIFDRADGKSPPAPAPDGGERERKVTFEWKPTTSSAAPPAPAAPASTNAAGASPAS